MDEYQPFEHFTAFYAISSELRVIYDPRRNFHKLQTPVIPDERFLHISSQSRASAECEVKEKGLLVWRSFSASSRMLFFEQVSRFHVVLIVQVFSCLARAVIKTRKSNHDDWRHDCVKLTHPRKTPNWIFRHSRSLNLNERRWMSRDCCISCCSHQSLTSWIRTPRGFAKISKPFRIQRSSCEMCKFIDLRLSVLLLVCCLYFSTINKTFHRNIFVFFHWIRKNCILSFLTWFWRSGHLSSIPTVFGSLHDN